MDFALYPIVSDSREVLFLHPTGVEITEIKRVEKYYRKLFESLDVQVGARTRELDSSDPGGTTILVTFPAGGQQNTAGEMAAVVQ